MQTNPEDLKENYPHSAEFFSKPGKIANKLEAAIRAGLTPDEIEAALGPLIEKGRAILEQSSSKHLSEREVQREQLKTKLLARLSQFNGGEKELDKFLKTFCQEEGIDLFPKPGWAVQPKANINADWNLNEDIAIEVKANAVWVYQKMMGQWYPLSFGPFQ